MARINHNVWFIIGLLLIGCETDKIIFSGPNHVRFTKTTFTEKESNSRIIQLEVHLAGPLSDEDLSILYSIGGNARENVDYMILGERGKVLIEEGEYFGYIEIQLINNANNIIREQDIVLTLTNVNDGKLTLGQGEGDIGKQCIFTIVDDCILGGYYNAQQDPLQIPIEDITITSQDCITYRLSNWNIYVFGEPFDFGLNFIDNGDNTLTIPQQDEGTPLHGIGTVDPISREIFMNITLEEDNELVTFTLKPE
jgi:hypothetical protein